MTETAPLSRGKRWLFSATLWLIMLVGTIIGFEIVSAVYITVREKKYVPPRELFERTNNSFIRDVTAARGGCRYVDTLFPHPYLGFVHHANPPCGMVGVNNIGLFGENFPVEKRTDRFVVLLTGGSVAAQLGQIGAAHPRHLEIALNRKYVSPSGKPFLILNGADGAWKQPQQLILFAMYADAVDGVVTLDGFNEVGMVDSTVRFEYPANNFVAVNPIINRSYSQVVSNWLAGKIVGAISDSPLLSRSHTAYVISRRLEGLATREIKEQDRKTSVESIFGLPEDWDRQRRVDFAISQYRKYVRAMDVIAADRRVLAAHFVQPVPAAGKILTEEERAAVGDLGYRELYLRMTKELLQLRRSGSTIHDLRNVFQEERGTIYEDAIHLRKQPNGESLGYRLLAERMADLLAASWRLKRRSVP